MYHERSLVVHLFTSQTKPSNFDELKLAQSNLTVGNNIFKMQFASNGWQRSQFFYYKSKKNAWRCHHWKWPELKQPHFDLPTYRTTQCKDYSGHGETVYEKKT